MGARVVCGVACEERWLLWGTGAVRHFPLRLVSPALPARIQCGVACGAPFASLLPCPLHKSLGALPLKNGALLPPDTVAAGQAGACKEVVRCVLDCMRGEGHVDSAVASAGRRTTLFFLLDAVLAVSGGVGPVCCMYGTTKWW